MMNPFVEYVLVNLPHFWEDQLLNEPKSDELLNVSVDGSAVNLGQFTLHKGMELTKWNMAILIIKKKLNENALRISHSEAARSQIEHKILMFFQSSSLRDKNGTVCWESHSLFAGSLIAINCNN